MRFHWWQTVLLACGSKLANSCCVFETKTNFLKNIFCTFSLFPVTFLPVVRKTNYIDTNNDSPQIVQYIVDKKDKLSFSYMLSAFRNFLLILKKKLCSFENEITNEVSYQERFSF